MKRVMVVLALLGVFGMGPFAFGAGMILVEDSSWWPGPPHPSPPWPGPHPPALRPHLFAPLQVESVKVRTSISDQVAVTTIDQEFFNPNSARLEGTFVFPVPKGAHLDKFALEIDGRNVEAELLPAQKARGIYEDIVRKLKDPALLEYAGLEMFKVRIFPIEPNSKKRVKLSYTELLPSDSGLVAYVLPLSTEKFSCKPVKNVVLNVELNTRRPLKSVYSPTHTVEVKRDGANRATVSYEANEVSAQADFALYFAAEKDEVGLNLLTYRSPGEDGYFLLLASPGLDPKDRKVLPKDVAFVLDTSGSMAGKKLEQAKKALLFCVENLNENDRFELIRFSTEVEPFFNQLCDASKANRQRAEDFVERLKPLGATAIDDALKKALELQKDRTRSRIERDDAANALRRSDASERPFVIIFLTDGRPTIGTTDEDQIVSNVKKAVEGHTRIFCFGIGTDVNTHLLDKITEETRGVSQYVLPEEDLELKVSSFFSKIKEPILTNPTLKFGNDVRVSELYPAHLPDLFNGGQLVLVGRFSGQGDSGVILEGSVNGGNRTFGFDAKFPAQCSENNFIPRLWATRRVGYLLDEIRLHGENSELRDEVTQLARKYGIVTPYTAYLIVEDEQRRDVPIPMRSLRGLNENPSARQEAADSWRQFTTDRGGDAGVASAMSGLALKTADAAAPATAGAEVRFGRRYGMAPSASTVASSPQPAVNVNQAIESSQQTQFAGGKSFFRNGNQWIDSEVQKTQNGRRVRIPFGSPEYFALLTDHPQTALWLAVGSNVQFVLSSVIYEISE
jgi:Ca-activated chloride channel family protein